MEQATGADAELLLRDSVHAAEKTAALLADGVSSDEAVQIALLNNPRARAALLDVGVSRADFVQSMLFSNPSLSLSFRFPDGGGLANFETVLTQNIAELWLIPARRRVAERRLDRTILQSARTIATIAFDARRAYVTAAKALKQEAVASDTLEITARLLQTAELRQTAGTGSEIDVNLARTNKLEVETDFRNAKLATIETRCELARVLGLTNSPGSLAIDASLPAPSNWELSAETLQQVSLESRLDLKVIEQTVGEAEALVEQERTRFWRSLEIGFALERAERRAQGDRDWLEETFYDSLQSGQFTPPNLMPRESQGNNVIAGPTLAIELPLWDQNQAQLAKAERLLEQAQQFRDALLVEVAQDIHSRLARARTAAANAAFFRDEQLPAAERNVTLSREAYRAGRLSLLNVLEAERSFLAARSGYLDALERAAIATVELEQVTGRPAEFLLEQAEPTKAAEEDEHSAPEPNQS